MPTTTAFTCARPATTVPRPKNVFSFCVSVPTTTSFTCARPATAVPRPRRLLDLYFRAHHYNFHLRQARHRCSPPKTSSRFVFPCPPLQVSPARGPPPLFPAQDVFSICISVPTTTTFTCARPATSVPRTRRLLDFYFRAHHYNFHLRQARHRCSPPKTSSRFVFPCPPLQVSPAPGPPPPFPAHDVFSICISLPTTAGFTCAKRILVLYLEFVRCDIFPPALLFHVVHTPWLPFNLHSSEHIDQLSVRVQCFHLVAVHQLWMIRRRRHIPSWFSDFRL